MRLRNLALPLIGALTFMACTAADAEAPLIADRQQPTANSGMIAPGAQTGQAVLVRRMEEAVWYAEIGRQLLAAQAELDRQASAADQPQQGTSRATPSGSGYNESDIEACIKQHESGGNPAAINPQTGDASGFYGFLDSTWAGYGGYRKASDAPPEVQHERFEQLWAGGAGASHWRGGCPSMGL